MATYYISITGNDTTNNGLSLGNAFRTIQHGNDVASSGDTILVNNGVYTTSIVAQLTEVTKSGLTFKSINKYGAKLNGQGVTDYAFIVGNSTGPISVSNVTIEDFEVYGFNNGFQFNAGLNASLIGNLVHDIGRRCYTSQLGQSGLFARPQYSHLTFARNIFHTIGRLHPSDGCAYASTFTNWQNNDHTMYLEASFVTIHSNIFYDMHSGWDIHLYPYSVNNYTIANNVFAEANPWRDGYILLSAPAFTNIDIVNNIFLSPTGSCSVEGGTSFRSTGTTTNVTIRNNITLNGSAGCFTKAGTTFTGNLNNTNPLVTNATAHDFTLTTLSPARGAGINLSSVFTTDFNNNTRGSSWDIGAYQYNGAILDTTPLATPTGLTVI